MKDFLRIAIQKSGRLNEQSLQLLNDCGVKVGNGTSTLKARASNFPLEVLFLRDDDIPQYVEDNVADIGILGENIIQEKGRRWSSCCNWVLQNAGYLSLSGRRMIIRDL